MAQRQGTGAGRARLIAGLALTGVGVGVGIALAKRAKLPANIREFNKRFTNPLMLRSVARGERGNLGVIIHRGRTSGREFTTPVRIDPIPGGFLIPLPYGTDTDWLKNIRAAGGTTLRFHGQDVAVDQPEIIDAATALTMLPATSAIAVCLMRIKHYVRLHRVDRPAALSAEEARMHDHQQHIG